MALTKLIEKTPPDLTGDSETDTAAMRNYLLYLREQFNFILTNIYKELNHG